MGQGIALLIFNDRGGILLSRQSEADEQYGRRAGQWNIVTETREAHELLKTTVIRALLEELGQPYEDFRVIPLTYRESDPDTYRRKWDYAYKYRCVCLEHTGGTDASSFRSCDGETTESRWVYPDELSGFEIEDGARFLIDYYLAFLVT
ncbi:NUDIX hydrolase [Patescibacteria group bacterium]|nr:NUDIX hydrolase [Patescibacteria group bacterium]